MKQFWKYGKWSAFAALVMLEAYMGGLMYTFIKSVEIKYLEYNKDLNTWTPRTENDIKTRLLHWEYYLTLIVICGLSIGVVRPKFKKICWPLKNTRVINSDSNYRDNANDGNKTTFDLVEEIDKLWNEYLNIIEADVNPLAVDYYDFVHFLTLNSNKHISSTSKFYIEHLINTYGCEILRKKKVDHEHNYKVII